MLLSLQPKHQHYFATCGEITSFARKHNITFTKRKHHFSPKANSSFNVVNAYVTTLPLIPGQIILILLQHLGDHRLNLVKREYGRGQRIEGATIIEAAEACGYADASSLLHAIASEKSSLQ